MKKLSLLLKLVKKKLAKFSKEKDHLIADNPLLSKKMDQKMVFNLSKKNLPTVSQLKTLPKFLTNKERAIVKLLITVIVICLILITGNFYFKHTILVPEIGGSYTEGLVGTPQYINPVLASYNDVDRDLSRMLFNGLLKLNKRSPTPKMPNPKPCAKCGEKFQPATQSTKLCDDCWKDALSRKGGKK